MKLKKVVKSLRALKKKVPSINYDEYWQEINRVHAEEHRAFTLEEQKLIMSNADYHRQFSI